MQAAIVGATGLIGRGVVQELFEAQSCSRITSIGRRPQGFDHRKWQERVGSMDAVESLCQGLNVDVAFCCLGTTIRKAGSREAFAAIDQHLPIRFARAVLQQGAQQFHVVSSLGADPASSSFYLRTKGLMEEGLRALGFPRLVIYRPSLLLGDREESRPMERMSALIYKGLRPIYPAFLGNWEPIEARDVARVMVREAQTEGSGTLILENRVLHPRSRN